MRHLDFAQQNHRQRLKNLINLKIKCSRLFKILNSKQIAMNSRENYHRTRLKSGIITTYLFAADKTTNFYQSDAPAYKKLLDTTITKDFKKAPPKTACKTISEEKKIAKSIGLDNRRIICCKKLVCHPKKP